MTSALTIHKSDLFTTSCATAGITTKKLEVHQLLRCTVYQFQMKLAYKTGKNMDRKITLAMRYMHQNRLQWRRNLSFLVSELIDDSIFSSFASSFGAGFKNPRLPPMMYFSVPFAMMWFAGNVPRGAVSIYSSINYQIFIICLELIPRNRNQLGLTINRPSLACGEKHVCRHGNALIPSMDLLGICLD